MKTWSDTLVVTSGNVGEGNWPNAVAAIRTLTISGTAARYRMSRGSHSFQAISDLAACLKNVNAVKVGGVRTSRRAFLASSLLSPVLLPLRAAPNVHVTDFELLPVRATARTVWLIVRLATDRGLTGLGEASDAFGFANTTKQDALRMESELRKFFGLVQGTSPLDIEAYRQKAEPIAAAGGLVSATAYSALEQALWDLAGQALEIPAYDLFGGKVRDRLPVYANINRATTLRTPEDFAETAKKAVQDGFRAIKGAPFDGFPKPGAAASEIRAAVDLGIACVAAMREAAGADVEVMVDCHSFFDVPLAQSVAERLERYNLAWYEEPVAPDTHRRDDRDPAVDPATDGGRGAALRSKGIRAAVPEPRGERHHAGREALRRAARNDADCGDGARRRSRSRAAQSERPGVHRGQCADRCGNGELPPS